MVAKHNNGMVATLEIARIDINKGGEWHTFDTETELEIEPEIEEEEGKALIVKGTLVAQKLGSNILKYNQLTVTDKTLQPELIKAVQGGTVEYTTKGTFKRYIPPKASEALTQDAFKMYVYSNIYNSGGTVTGYQCIKFGNCKGDPVTFTLSDEDFSEFEYVIKASADDAGYPYEIIHCKTLPDGAEPTPVTDPV